MTGVQTCALPIYGVHADVFPDNRYSVYPVTPLSVVDTPSDKIIILDKGANQGSGSYYCFTPFEWDWDSQNLFPGGYKNGFGTYDASKDTGDLTYIGGTTSDCDDPGANPNVPSSYPWPGCGIYPHYRHTGTANAVFMDGHAKAMPRHTIQWYKNIFVKSGKEVQYVQQGWYPY